MLTPDAVLLNEKGCYMYKVRCKIWYSWRKKNLLTEKYMPNSEQKHLMKKVPILFWYSTNDGIFYIHEDCLALMVNDKMEMRRWKYAYKVGNFKMFWIYVWTKKQNWYIFSNYKKDYFVGYLIILRTYREKGKCSY
jgi:hypothetical protein